MEGSYSTGPILQQKYTGANTTQNEFLVRRMQFLGIEKVPNSPNYAFGKI